MLGKLVFARRAANVSPRPRKRASLLPAENFPPLFPSPPFLARRFKHLRAYKLPVTFFFPVRLYYTTLPLREIEKSDIFRPPGDLAAEKADVISSGVREWEEPSKKGP